MSVIQWPTALVPGPGSGFGQQRHDLGYPNDVTGARQDRLLGPPRWTLSVVQPAELDQVTAGQWQALTARLRGRVNHLLAWDFGKPAPLGTMRGTMTLSAQANAGATQLQITAGVGQALKTLLAGDKLQVGTGLGTSQLVMVTVDAAANGSGVITVNIEPPLRLTFATATAVVWDKPSAHFKARETSNAWAYTEGSLSVTGLAFDFLEAWS